MKNLHTFSIIILCLSFSLASAQTTPQIQWQNTISGYDEDQLHSVIQTADGGYLLGGSSKSDDHISVYGDKTEYGERQFDYWVVKLDGLGNIQWQNTIGGKSDDYLYTVVQTTEGGYLLGGYSSSGISGDKTEASQGSYDYWVVKLNGSGNIEWQNTIGGSKDDYLHSVIETTSGGYLLGGNSLSGVSGDKTEASLGSDYWVVKLDNSGNIEWQNTIGGNQGDYLRDVIQTTDGGYLLGGYSYSDVSGDKTEANEGSNDYWVLKLNGSGNIEWQNTIGGSSMDYLYSVIQTTDGGYLLGGDSDSGISGDKTEDNNGGSFGNDYWVVKLNGSGNIDWQNTIGGSGGDFLYSVIQTTDGGYLLGGDSDSDISGDKIEVSLGVQGWSDYWVVKLDGSGNIEWQNTIGGKKGDYLRSVLQTTDGGYLLGGFSDSNGSKDKTEPNHGATYTSDYWVVKLFAEDSSALCTTPSNLSENNITVTSAILQWNAVADAIKYVVRYKVGGTSTWVRVNSASPAVIISGLMLDTRYIWQVQSVCSVQPIGSSEWSAKESFTTKPLKLAFAPVVDGMNVYPNPASSSVAISFQLSQSSKITIELNDVSGRKVRTIAEGNFEAGDHQFSFERENLNAGVYLLQMRSESGIVTQKLIIN